MLTDDWRVLATFGNRIGAQALVGLLDSEGLACRFASNEPVPGLGTQFAVLVPTALLQRAQRLWAQSQVSEQELTDLALATPPRESEPP